MTSLVPYFSLYVAFERGKQVDVHRETSLLTLHFPVGVAVPNLLLVKNAKQCGRVLFLATFLYSISQTPNENGKLYKLSCTNNANRCRGRRPSTVEMGDFVMIMNEDEWIKNKLSHVKALSKAVITLHGGRESVRKNISIRNNVGDVNLWQQFGVACDSNGIQRLDEKWALLFAIGIRDCITRNSIARIQKKPQIPFKPFKPVSLFERRFGGGMKVNNK